MRLVWFGRKPTIRSNFKKLNILIFDGNQKRGSCPVFGCKITILLEKFYKIIVEVM